MTVQEAVAGLDLSKTPRGMLRMIDRSLERSTDSVSPSLIRFIDRLRLDAGKTRIGK